MTSSGDDLRSFIDETEPSQFHPDRWRARLREGRPERGPDGDLMAPGVEAPIGVDPGVDEVEAEAEEMIASSPT